ncbi:hypothetical protein HS088_TW08G00289 [Tripterygium wilfordii]|uniref:DUF7950 domain-containing protein n=1 Tax=Tripterygium wilfordii TaxID=458696 RepID=A0A7J7DBG5_TRIWF|nr:uncharacterized protein LOC120003767 [Tripterygium wilfordii]KAF5743702.1 hypothetical protein HS088_TW08G00289 [Tripterygium wilfordii]
MDGRGGCCIARYGGGAYDMSKMDRIMLRFRPIAPKPATGSVSNGPSPDQAEISPRSGRGKRRTNQSTSINSKKCNGSVRKRKSSLSQEKMVEVVTLPLLPETPERKDSPARVSSAEILSPMKSHGNAPVWLSFDRSMENHDQKVVLDPTMAMMPQTVRAVGSCVTVECVTDTWVDGNGMGSTDVERSNNMWKDTCPGFISDGMGRVTWTNGAFEKMVGPGNILPVVLVMKEKASLAMMMMTWKAFTCRLRLQYTRGMEKSSLTLPCDVWRMDGGGFAWRLDVKAALSLGR